MGFGLAKKENWEAQAQEGDAGREDDTYLMAHRINGSLASILGNAQLLLFDLQNVASEPARRRLAAIRDEARCARDELLKLMDWKESR